MSAAEPAGKREKKLKTSTAKASRVAGDSHRRHKNTKQAGHTKGGAAAAAAGTNHWS